MNQNPQTNFGKKVKLVKTHQARQAHQAQEVRKERRLKFNSTFRLSYREEKRTVNWLAQMDEIKCNEMKYDDNFKPTREI